MYKHSLKELKCISWDFFALFESVMRLKIHTCKGVWDVIFDLNVDKHSR